MPQAQRYCAGRFSEWDPKITTLPGLYLVGAVWARVVAVPARLLGWQVSGWQACLDLQLSWHHLLAESCDTSDSTAAAYAAVQWLVGDADAVQAQPVMSLFRCLM